MTDTMAAAFNTGCDDLCGTDLAGCRAWCGGRGVGGVLVAFVGGLALVATAGISGGFDEDLGAGLGLTFVTPESPRDSPGGTAGALRRC